MKTPKIILGVTTLVYEKACVDSLLQLANAHIFDGFCIPGLCLLPFSRNKVISMAYENCPDFTHLLFIDDDMTGFQAEHVLKLVQDDKDIISALVTQRNPPYKLVATFPGKDDSDVYEAIKKKELLQSTHLGMAFTLIKREVLDRVREETEDGPIWFTLDRWPRKNYEAELADKIVDTIKRIDTGLSVKEALSSVASFGEQAHRGSILIGEDIEFCKRVRALGFETWVDCGVVVGHLGKVSFDFRHALMEAYGPQNGKENQNANSDSSDSDASDSNSQLVLS